jgi:aspartate kinase
MRVFKFGGASVKNAEGVRNLAKILKSYDDKIVVVISAMGKMTNAFERLLNAYFDKQSCEHYYNEIYNFHLEIMEDLFPSNAPAFKDIEGFFKSISQHLKKTPSFDYNYEYDQLVSYGELISTTIISEFLKYDGIENEWIDIRGYLKTNDAFREARINWGLSEKLIKNRFNFKKRIYVTQGFIASNSRNLTTTLGREGSDFSAAILAYILDLNSLTVWKDVPGVLNADPKYFNNTIKIDCLSYKDAIELAYYGMSIIHPRTIQPLQKKNIKLYVRSFFEPAAKGTIVSSEYPAKQIPCYIVKPEQVLINIAPRDLSFIAEEHLQDIFLLFSEYGFKINLMQNTAVSFKICVNDDYSRLAPILKKMEMMFDVSLQKHLELITIRHFDTQTIEQVLHGKEKILEQRTKENVQIVADAMK